MLDAALAAGDDGAVVTDDGLPSPRDDRAAAGGKFPPLSAGTSAIMGGAPGRSAAGAPESPAVSGAGAGPSAAASAVGDPSAAVAAAATAAVVANFEADFTNLAPEDSVVDRSTKLSSTALEKTHFEGFTYTGAGELLHDATAFSGSGGSSGAAFAAGSSGGAFGSSGLRGGGSAFGSVHDEVVGSAGSSGFYQEEAGAESSSR